MARFDFQPGVDYVVSFNRVQDRYAPDSRVTMPPAFTIVTPANHQQVTDGETVMVRGPHGRARARVTQLRRRLHLTSGSHGFSSGPLGTDSNADGQESVRIDPIVDAARSGSPSTVSRCSIDLIVSHEPRGASTRHLEMAPRSASCPARST